MTPAPDPTTACAAEAARDLHRSPRRRQLACAGLEQRGWAVLAVLMPDGTTRGDRRLMCDHISARGEPQVLPAKPRGQELRGGDAKVSNTRIRSCLVCGTCG